MPDGPFIEIIELAQICLQLGPVGIKIHSYLDFNAHGLAGIWKNPVLRKHFVDETLLTSFLQTVTPEDTETRLLLRLTKMGVINNRPFRYEDWRDWDVNAEYATAAFPRDWHNLLGANRALFLRALAQAILAFRDQASRAIETQRLEQEEPPKSRQCELTLKGGCWELRFDGTPAYLTRQVGLAYIAELMRRPNLDIPAEELMASCARAHSVISKREATANGLCDDTGSGDRDGVVAIDEEAKQNYRKERERIQDRIATYQQLGNPEEQAKAQAELDELNKYTATQFSKNGRIRKIGSASETARKNVTISIKRALEHVEKNHSSGASDWLRLHIVTGATCRFSSAPARPEN